MDKPLDILAIGSHPDDVEMTCAGLLLKLKAKGYITGVLHLTRGEMGSRGGPEERQHEAAAAAGIMQVDWFDMLDLGDSRMRVDQESVTAVAAVLRRVRPRLVVAPFPRDPHPDHAKSGRIVAEAVHVAGLVKYPLAGEPHHVGQLIYSMYRGSFKPSFVVDVTAEFATKKAAVLAYHSQVGPTLEGEAESRLSSPQFMRSWEARHIYYGTAIGCKYGEAYFAEYAIPLDDPVTLFAVPQQRRMAIDPQA